MNAQLARAVEAAYLELDLLDVGAASPGPDTHVVLRRLLDALSTPPADDVREALADLLMSDRVMNVDAAGRDYAYVEADAILAAFDVRPRGTVTDAAVEAASEQFATSILVPERETRLAQSSFVAGVEWRERAAREARS